MTMKLHVSIGPVQEFVSQSRRTRDLWASSFLLSYLAGRAMAAITRLDGRNRIILPAITREELIPYHDKDGENHPEPHATLPNRFIAEVVDAASAGQAATDAVRAAWSSIAEVVYKRFIARMSAPGYLTSEIWKRQIDTFWEIMWVAGADPEILDQRKHWRIPRARVEPGDHCSMMGDYQELSGYVRAHQLQQQDDFWHKLRNQAGESNLRNDERLCAIALVKRLFPLVAKKCIGVDLRNDAVSWPSTLYVAAWPWINEICKHLPEQAAAYAGAAVGARRSEQDSALGERGTGSNLHTRYPHAGDFPLLDGNFMFSGALENPRATPMKDADDRTRLGQMLADLYETARVTPGITSSPPSPFYAMLLMDGDSMGTLLEDARKQGQTERVTHALTAFARSVPDIVSKHEGYTVYAGGDDVLALLPIGKALPAALALQHDYRQRFVASGLDGNLAARASISAALLFAHYHLPLRGLLRRAHILLDTVAKDQTGRDSVAMAIHKSSGESAVWAIPWAALRTSDDQTLLDPLIEQLEARNLATSFIYRLRAALSRITESRALGPGAWLDTLGDLDLESLIAAEILIDRRTEGMEQETAREVARALARVLVRVRRDPYTGALIGGPAAEHGHQPPAAGHQIGFDGAMIAGFLASRGHEEQP